MPTPLYAFARQSHPKPASASGQPNRTQVDVELLVSLLSRQQEQSVQLDALLSRLLELQESLSMPGRDDTDIRNWGEPNERGPSIRSQLSQLCPTESFKGALTEQSKCEIPTEPPGMPLICLQVISHLQELHAGCTSRSDQSNQMLNSRLDAVERRMDSIETSTHFISQVSRPWCPLASYF